jgi:fibro-slime domain-containing protein
MTFRAFYSRALVCLVWPAVACSASGSDGSPVAAGGSAAGMTGSSAGTAGVSLGLAGISSGGSTTDRPPAVIEKTLPAGFTAETLGGWRVLGPLAELSDPTLNACANVLRIVARDFTQAHIDFGQQKPASWADPGLYEGHVLPNIGDDRKPQINPARMPLDVMEGFADWYASVDTVNVAYVMDLWLQPDATKDGYFVFDSNSFFPLDAHNTSPGDVQTGGNDNGPHNFLFTTELHTSFEYKGGEVFNFRGDDDVFVFINGRLAVDIGGIHGPLPGNVDLAERATELGIQVGNVYTLDLFQAERNPGGSNFRIETSLDFKECGILPGDVK